MTRAILSRFKDDTIRLHANRADGFYTVTMEPGTEDIHLDRECVKRLRAECDRVLEEDATGVPERRT